MYVATCSTDLHVRALVFQLKAVASQLSLRQMLRIARRLARFPDNNMHDTVHKACLGRFLPRMARTSLDETLERLSIAKPSSSEVESLENALSCKA